MFGISAHKEQINLSLTSFFYISQLSPGSSPGVNELESVFVYNDLRKGGPQSGHEGAETKTIGDVRRVRSVTTECLSARLLIVD